jgi:hypothetical protein
MIRPELSLGRTPSRRAFVASAVIIVSFFDIDTGAEDVS